jgi:indole-3-glycerol phosphate synthase
MRYKREQLPAVMRAVPLADLRAFASVAPPTSDFESALKTSGLSLIAECKKASPSRGLISPDYDPVQLARIYVEGGAVAISVLTDARYFQGSLGDLRDVKEMIGTSFSPKFSSRSSESRPPVLRKDFTFHAYHVYEARAAGADAILLIAAVLEGRELESLQDLAHELGMAALLEVHTEEELDRVLAIKPRIVGINNRNLQTFEVDFDNTARLRAKIPEDVVTIAESGIKSIDDVKRMGDLNVDAILVGETLVRSKNVLAQTRAFANAGQAE